MTQKTFTTATDAEIWTALSRSIACDEAALRFIRAIENTDQAWCCRLAARTARITFKDGTQMRVHFCPRCGKEL